MSKPDYYEIELSSDPEDKYVVFCLSHLPTSVEYLKELRALLPSGYKVEQACDGEENNGRIFTYLITYKHNDIGWIYPVK